MVSVFVFRSFEGLGIFDGLALTPTTVFACFSSPFLCSRFASYKIGRSSHLACSRNFATVPKDCLLEIAFLKLTCLSEIVNKIGRPSYLATPRNFAAVHKTCLLEIVNKIGRFSYLAGSRNFAAVPKTCLLGNVYKIGRSSYMAFPRNFVAVPKTCLVEIGRFPQPGMNEAAPAPPRGRQPMS